MTREQVNWPGAAGICCQCFEPVSSQELYRHRPGGRAFHKRCFDIGGYYVQVEKKKKREAKKVNNYQ